jgi:hypothetical protein
MIAVAVALLLIPESYWVWYETAVDFRGPRIPNWMELGHLGAILVLYALIISMTKFGEAPFVTRVRSQPDALASAARAAHWWWTFRCSRSPMAGLWPSWPRSILSAAAALLTTILIVPPGRCASGDRGSGLPASARNGGLALIMFP